MPLGLVYGYAVEPRLRSVAPFWIAAVALSLLSLPHSYELEDFQDPMPADPNGEARP